MCILWWYWNFRAFIFSMYILRSTMDWHDWLPLEAWALENWVSEIVQMVAWSVHLKWDQNTSRLSLGLHSNRTCGSPDIFLFSVRFIYQIYFLPYLKGINWTWNWTRDAAIMWHMRYPLNYQGALFNVLLLKLYYYCIELVPFTFVCMNTLCAKM